jgi:hypothetical protein
MHYVAWKELEITIGCGFTASVVVLSHHHGLSPRLVHAHMLFFAPQRVSSVVFSSLSFHCAFLIRGYAVRNRNVEHAR